MAAPTVFTVGAGTSGGAEFSRLIQGAVRHAR